MVRWSRYQQTTGLVFRMYYSQALQRLKRSRFGILIEDGKNSDGKFIYYTRPLKGDDDIEEIKEEHIHGRVVVVKSGNIMYFVDKVLNGGAGDQE